MDDLLGNVIEDEPDKGMDDLLKDYSFDKDEEYLKLATEIRDNLVKMNGLLEDIKRNTGRQLSPS